MIKKVFFAYEKILYERTKKIHDIKSKFFQNMIDDMFETMYYHNGVGLAAPQIGENYRLAVLDVKDGNPLVIVNPKIVRAEGSRKILEGCLSVPEWLGDVVRSEKVVVEAQDRNGKTFRVRAESNLLAQCLEHEIDHLDGKLFIQKIKSSEELWRITNDGK